MSPFDVYRNCSFNPLKSPYFDLICWGLSKIHPNSKIHTHKTQTAPFTSSSTSSHLNLLDWGASRLFVFAFTGWLALGFYELIHSWRWQRRYPFWSLQQLHQQCHDRTAHTSLPLHIVCCRIIARTLLFHWMRRKVAGRLGAQVQSVNYDIANSEKWSKPGGTPPPIAIPECCVVFSR